MIRQRNAYFVLPRRELEELIDERPVVGVIESKVFRVIGNGALMKRMSYPP